MKNLRLAGLGVLLIGALACTGKVNQDFQVKKVETTHEHSSDTKDWVVDNKIDPICGMSTEGHVSDTVHYNTKVYGFCSSGCKEMFKEAPEQYLSKMGD